MCNGFPGAIDAIVSDIVMPGMTGPELVRQLLYSRPEIGVLYVSGYADDAIRQGILDQPGAFFVPKPYSPAVLVAKVAEMMAARKTSRVATEM